MRCVANVEEDFWSVFSTNMFRGISVAGAFGADEVDTLWEGFRLKVGLTLGEAKSTNLTHRFGNNFVATFLRKHHYIPFVPAIKTGMLVSI